MSVPPPLRPPTTYRATRVRRIRDILFAVLAGGFGLFLLAAAAMVRRPLSGLEWFFVLLVAVPVFVFAVQGARRSRIVERIDVTATGFVVRDAWSESRVAWKDVIGAMPFGFWGEDWIDVMLAPDAHRRKIRLSITGLEPPAREFLRQVYHFAPASPRWEPGLVRVARGLGIGRKSRLDPSSRPPGGTP